MNKRVAKEILAVARELLAAEVVMRHELVRLGGSAYAVIYRDYSVAIHAGDVEVMVDAQQAKKLADAIR